MFLDNIFNLIDDWLIQEENLNLDELESIPIDYPEQYYLSEEIQYLSLDLELGQSFLDSPDYFIYEESWDIAEFNGVGNPWEDAQFWQYQEGSNSCAIVAQMGVFQSLTGLDVLESELCQIAEANGWFDPHSGTTLESMDNILNSFGLSTESYYNANLNDIAEALANGDKVIVALDAQEIWQPLRDNNDNPLEQLDAGHAVWVTGIDQLPDGSIKIIINDSGTSDGQMKVVDAVDFINAWDDFGNYVVITHNSPSLVTV
ncbi:MAG: hypothetical protein EA365_06795 [Gloeocapsa sp. DLM2.Bin57]|nr:MAG: hypothetical protein EA365_06795 [Gloeocapsa sp. DLM2.Bin57]